MAVAVQVVPWTLKAILLTLISIIRGKKDIEERKKHEREKRKSKSTWSKRPENAKRY